MPSIRTAALACVYLAAANASPLQIETTNPDSKQIPSSSHIPFSQLLMSVPQDALHAILDTQLAGKLRHGIFEHTEQGAISAVHQEDPVLETRLVELAKRGAGLVQLHQRQAPTANSSTASATPSASATLTTSLSSTTTSTSTISTSLSSSSSSLPTTTTISASIPSTTSGAATTITPSSTLPSSTRTQTPSTLVPASQASATVVQPIATTNAAGSTLLTSRTVPAILLSSTNAAGYIQLLTSPVPTTTPPAFLPGSGSGPVSGSGPGSGFAPRDVTTTDAYGNLVVLSHVVPGQIVTAIDSAGRTVVMTYIPPATATWGRSELVLRTTTLPNGEVVTITSFSVVGGADPTPTGTATETAGDGGARASGTRGTPSLQGAAGRVKAEWDGLWMLVGLGMGVAGFWQGFALV